MQQHSHKSKSILHHPPLSLWRGYESAAQVACALARPYSHYPYSRDGEGREADGQDNPGSHWAAGEGFASKAWGYGGLGGAEREQDARVQPGTLAAEGTQGGHMKGGKGQQGCFHVTRHRHHRTSCHCQPGKGERWTEGEEQGGRARCVTKNKRTTGEGSLDI